LISLSARVAARRKYQKTIALMEATDAAYNILVAIRSIIAATDAKAKIRPHLFGLSGKSKTGKTI